MKIKVSFAKVVEADSVDDAYAKVLGCLDGLIGSEEFKAIDAHLDSEESPPWPWTNPVISTLTHEKRTYMRCHTKLTEMNGFVFEDLGEHSGYGEGSIEDWTDTD